MDLFLARFDRQLDADTKLTVFAGLGSANIVKTDGDLLAKLNKPTKILFGLGGQARRLIDSDRSVTLGVGYRPSRHVFRGLNREVAARYRDDGLKALRLKHTHVFFFTFFKTHLSLLNRQFVSGFHRFAFNKVHF